MPRCNTVISIKSRTSHRAHLLDHLGLAEVAGFCSGRLKDCQSLILCTANDYSMHNFRFPAKTKM